MIEIAVNNLAAATGARTVTGEADRVCRGCVIDSRQVEEGTIFVAFPGENVDGNDFASRAVQSGAGAVVMTREPEAELVSMAQDKGCAILLTDDPEEFLLRLAHTYRLELGAWSLALLVPSARRRPRTCSPPCSPSAIVSGPPRAISIT